MNKNKGIAALRETIIILTIFLFWNNMEKVWEQALTSYFPLIMETERINCNQYI